jgi:hypothetical protein
MSVDRHGIQILARLLVGLPVEPADLANLPASWRRLADAIPPTGDVGARVAALKAALAGRPDRATILAAIVVAARTAHLQPGAPPADSESLILLADVESRPVRWLWPGRLPLGKLTVLDGDPGLGKSAITLDVAARVSAGRPFPDGAASDLDGPRGVVLLSAEDGLADTVRPRLLAAGADLAHVSALTSVVDRPLRRRRPDTAARPVFRLPNLADLVAIRRAVRAVGAALVVVDPIMAYLPRDVDSGRDSAVRALLARLAGLAQAEDVAVLVVRHLTKRAGRNPLYRGGGSIGIIGAARSGLLVARDPADPTNARRVLASTKANLALAPASLAYHLAPADPAAGNGSLRVVWEGPPDHTAATLLDAAPDRDPDGPAALSASQDILRTLLADGPKLATAVQAEARLAGVSGGTLRRACHALGIRPRKDGYQGAWIWELPPTPSEQGER